MTIFQPGILQKIPPLSRYLEFKAIPDKDIMPSLRKISELSGMENLVIGFGYGLVQMSDSQITNLRSFPSLTGAGYEIPSTQADIWCWVRGDDRGQILYMMPEYLRH